MAIEDEYLHLLNEAQQKLEQTKRDLAETARQLKLSTEQLIEIRLIVARLMATYNLSTTDALLITVRVGNLIGRENLLRKIEQAPYED